METTTAAAAADVTVTVTVCLADRAGTDCSTAAVLLLAGACGGRAVAASFTAELWQCHVPVHSFDPTAAIYAFRHRPHPDVAAAAAAACICSEAGAPGCCSYCAPSICF